MTRYARLTPDGSLHLYESSNAPDGTWTAVAPAADDPPRPSLHHRMTLIDNAIGWVDTRSMSEAKASKIAYLRDVRDSVLNSTFTWDGSVFDSDQVSQTRLMGLYIDSQNVGFTSQPWRLSDNSWRVLDAEDAAGVWAALKAHVTAQFARFAVREAAVNLATTVAEVDAIVW